MLDYVYSAQLKLITIITNQENQKQNKMNKQADNQLKPGDPEYERLAKIRDQMLESVKQNVYEDNMLHAQQIRA